jgi:light-regulated signal transduction histidine kinase (bacteriophytochrome)
MASDELSGTRSELLPINKFHVALLGIAGHDLRQPLQAIQNTYDLARTRALGQREQALLDNGEQAVTGLNEQLDRLLGTLCYYERTKTIESSSVALAPLFWQLANENEDAVRVDERKAPALRGGSLTIDCEQRRLRSNFVAARHLNASRIMLSAPAIR